MTQTINDDINIYNKNNDSVDKRTNDYYNVEIKIYKT
jgi:hypothetical protein